ncbi:hypothetical protein PIB30_001531 [Stylosanthes scabra]|uniref:Uncharacterized protein n=1 Tax=Stylosanthes scabra TaxID=79078 RepID=A0ABU6R1Q5_9FABA|nr:hypothetical protein [Stylosanthes scabra]
MGGASFLPSRKCVCTMASAPPSDSSSIFMMSISLRMVMGTSPSELIKAGGCLIPMKNQFRNSNGTISRFWLLPESEPFGWIMRTSPSLRCVQSGATRDGCLQVSCFFSERFAEEEQVYLRLIGRQDEKE